MLKRRSEIKGFQDGGMNVDPVSGNDVPVGSLPEEVRDDVDAKLSPGEFVIPADVVRFIGLERLMKMRDEAKKGIQRMAEIGQMGNADEVGEESNSTYEDDGFESEIDDILGEVERENEGVEMAGGGFIAKLMGKTIRESAEKAGTKAPVTATKNLTTEQDLRTSITDRINVEKELGRRQMEGFDYKFKEGQRVFTKDSAAKNRPPMTIVGKTRVGNKIVTEDGTLTGKKVIDPVTGKAKRTPYEPGYRVRVKQGEDELEFDIPQSAIVSDVEMAFGGYVGSGTDLTKAPKNPVFDVRYYKNKEGATMFITHINGKPMTPVPEGFTQVSAEEAQKVGQAADEEAKKKAAATPQEGYSATELDPETAKWLDAEAKTPGAREARMTRVNANLERITGNLPFIGAAKKVGEFFMGKQRTDEEAKKIPIEQRGPVVDQAATLAGTMAFQRASESGLSEPESRDFARQASEAAAIFSRSGMDTQTAARTAVEEQQNLRDIEANQESSVGSPESTPEASWGGGSAVGPDWNKGGFVGKRQYPAKKKKGKGIAASK